MKVLSLFEKQLEYKSKWREEWFDILPTDSLSELKKYKYQIRDKNHVHKHATKTPKNYARK